MRLSPPVVRSLVVGSGLGIGLWLLTGVVPRGLWSGVVSLVSLTPLALALAFGGPLGAVAAGLVAGAVTTTLLGSGAVLALGLREGLPGLALGMALARRFSVPVSLMVVAGVSLAGLVVLLGLAAPAGVSPFAYLTTQIDAHVAALESLPGRLGMGEDPGWAAESARLVAWTMRVAGPGIVALGVLLGATANYLVARTLLRGWSFRPFAEEAVPDHLVWGVIAGGLLLASRQAELERAGLNLLIVLTPLYAVQGLAVFRFFLQRIGVPRLLQALGFALFALQPLLLVAVAGVGLSDLWIDFRKIRQAPTPA